MAVKTRPLQAWRQEFEELLGESGCWLVEWRLARPIEGQGPWNWKIRATIRRAKVEADRAADLPSLTEFEEARLAVHEHDERVQRARAGAKEVAVQVGAPDVPCPSRQMQEERGAREALAADRRREEERAGRPCRGAPVAEV